MKHKLGAKLLSGILSFALIIGMTPLTVSAAGVTKRTSPLDLETDGNISYVDAKGDTKTANPTTTSIMDTGEGWSWDNTYKVLTLNNANFDVSSRGFAVVSLPNTPVTLVLEGNSTIKASSASYGIYTYGDVITRGSGQLNINMEKSNGALYADNLIMDTGKLVCNVDFKVSDSCCILVEDLTVRKGAELEAISTNVTNPQSVASLMVIIKNFELDGGKVTVKSSKGGRGISCPKIAVRSGELSVEIGKNAGIAYSDFYAFSGNLTMTGGTVNLKMDDLTETTKPKNLKCINGNLIMTNGVLDVKAGAVQAGKNSFAVAGDVAITGGKATFDVPTGQEVFDSTKTKTFKYVSSEGAADSNHYATKASIHPRKSALDLTADSIIYQTGEDTTATATANPRSDKIDAEYEGWSWDPNNGAGVLTLNGAQISAEDKDSALKLPGGAKIEMVTGTNSLVENTKKTDTTYAVSSDTNLTFSSSDMLNGALTMKVKSKDGMAAYADTGITMAANQMAANLSIDSAYAPSMLEGDEGKIFRAQMGIGASVSEVTILSATRGSDSDLILIDMDNAAVPDGNSTEGWNWKPGSGYDNTKPLAKDNCTGTLTLDGLRYIADSEDPAITVPNGTILVVKNNSIINNINSDIKEANYASALICSTKKGMSIKGDMLVEGGKKLFLSGYQITLYALNLAINETDVESVSLGEVDTKSGMGIAVPFVYKQNGGTVSGYAYPKNDVQNSATGMYAGDFVFNSGVFYAKVIQPEGRNFQDIAMEAGHEITLSSKAKIELPEGGRIAERTDEPYQGRNVIVEKEQVDEKDVPALEVRIVSSKPSGGNNTSSGGTPSKVQPKVVQVVTPGAPAVPSGAWDGKTVGPTGGALYLDTKDYTMNSGTIYDVKAVLLCQNNETLKVYSSQPGVATVEKLPNGNYRVTGKAPGETFIMFEVYSASGQLINHASVKVTISSGAANSGTANRAASLF